MIFAKHNRVIDGPRSTLVDRELRLADRERLAVETNGPDTGSVELF
jgi:hypothetical protein